MCRRRICTCGGAGDLGSRSVPVSMRGEILIDLFPHFASKISAGQNLVLVLHALYFCPTFEPLLKFYALHDWTIWLILLVLRYCIKFIRIRRFNRLTVTME